MRKNKNIAVRARQRACDVIDRAMAGGVPDPWLLPDDGVYDEQAVIVASRGRRRVKLTKCERVAAATAILLYRGSVTQVYKRLGLPRVPGE